MSDITFSKEEKLGLVEMLQTYFLSEMDQELGRFEAEFLLDHLSKQLGPVFYNKGLLDGRALIEKHIDNYNEALYGLEKEIDVLHR
ncbi:DUF2164 domain-containing protein [uncultured Cohaesibacter sp.]|uniref:DUF2164 domain-containing protein n=1 Tax=uncultured Cohaesibacter sp. TaxID=1002546 RepID=UPI00292D75EA|nr:DUF2164 domain-containing protein [uncultured Cohaesibacter sp.]